MTLLLFMPTNRAIQLLSTLVLVFFLTNAITQWSQCIGFPLQPPPPPPSGRSTPAPASLSMLQQQGDIQNTDLDLPDISEQLFSVFEKRPTLATSNPVRFPLQHREIPASHMNTLAQFKPHLVVEDLTPHSWASASTQSSHLERRETTESWISPLTQPSIDLTLTEIPKSYGYTATFSIGTLLLNGTHKDPIETTTTEFDLLVDTGSGLVVVTSSSCSDPECVQVQNRFDCQASITCRPHHPSPLTDTDPGQGMKNWRVQDEVDKHSQGELKSKGSRWFQVYGDGTIANGTLVLDSIRFPLNVSSQAQTFTSPSFPSTLPATQTTLSQIEVKNQPILVVDQPGLFLFKSYGPGMDGIAGLSLGVPGIEPTLLHNLQSLQESTFSPLSVPRLPKQSFMSLWLHEDGNFARDHGGELLINAVDRSRFQGPIHWNKRGPSTVDWSISLDGGIALSFPASHNSTLKVVTIMAPSSPYSTTPMPFTGSEFAVIDSGSAGIYFQKPLYHALFEALPGARQLLNGYWRVPCTGSAELQFGIGSHVYSIPYVDWVKPLNESVSVGPFRPRPRPHSDFGSNLVLEESSSAGGDPDWPKEPMCQARIYGSSPGPILLGTTFLKTVYTIFDFSERGFERIGFASLRQ